MEMKIKNGIIEKSTDWQTWHQLLQFQSPEPGYSIQANDISEVK
jgi:hypothetical protein